ncbi:MAG: DMT family transporter [Roseiarcus sp.]
MHAAEKRLSLGLPIRPAWPARAPNVGQADLARALARFAPFTALVVGAVAIGVSPISVRLADVGPFASAFWRVTLALPLLWAWARFADGSGRPSQRFAPATILSGLAFAGTLIFWHPSITHTSVANATFFATTAPIWVVLFGWLLGRQRLKAEVLIGLGLCLLGGAALLAQSFQLKPAGAVGDLLGIATGVFYGLYFLAVQAARKTTSAARVTFEATLITATILFVVALVTEPTILPRSGTGLAALIVMAWISHSGGQGLLAIALGRLPATFSSLVIFLEAIAAAGFAWAALGEPVSLVQALGGVTILAGIFVARPRFSQLDAARHSGVPSAASSACASAISGISGVSASPLSHSGEGSGVRACGPASSGRSPSSPTLLRGEGGDANHSSADASTAWASAGRAVDW